MMLSRRSLAQIATFLVALHAVNTPTFGQNRSKNKLLPFPEDLAQITRVANTAGQPLVLMVSLPGCPWCELLRRNYLGPMRSEGVAAYEFMVNERSREIKNFQGQRTTPAALSAALKVTNTPTVLFFGTNGLEIAPRIEGVGSVDFIGAVIEERLATARQHLKSAK